MSEAAAKIPANSAAKNKPKLALAIGTVLGVGYAKRAPGTMGSLVGVVAAMVAALFFLRPATMRQVFSGRPLAEALLKNNHLFVPGSGIHDAAVVLPIASAALLLVLLAAAGVWSSARVAEYAGAEDPQYVVIDEVSGQYITLILPLIPVALPDLTARMDFSQYAIFAALSLLNWKYLLAGFILFRVFDIWKPFPIRRLEKLPNGWGIMADDWLAAVYAAIVLRIGLHFLQV